MPGLKVYIPDLIPIVEFIENNKVDVSMVICGCSDDFLSYEVMYTESQGYLKDIQAPEVSIGGATFFYIEHGFVWAVIIFKNNTIIHMGAVKEVVLSKEEIEKRTIAFLETLRME